MNRRFLSPSRFILAVFFMCALSTCATALDRTSVIGGKRTVLAVIKIGEAYNLLIELARSFKGMGSTPMKAQMAQLFGVAARNFEVSRANARRAKCFANLRIIQSAVEMYNMDNPQLLKTLDFSALQAKNYLREVPDCPEGGRYSASESLAEGGCPTCSIHGSVKDFKGTPTEAEQPATSEADLKTLEKSASTLLEFHEQALFRPKGGIWVGLDPLKGGGFFIEADCKPGPLLDFLKPLGLPPIPEPVSKSETEIVFKVESPTGPGKLVLSKDGLLFEQFRDPSGSLEDSWKDFLKQADSPDSTFLLEVSPGLIREGLGGKTPPAGPFTAILPDLVAKQKGFRVALGSKEVLLAFCVEDAKTRGDFKTLVENQIGIFKPLGAKLLLDASNSGQIPEQARPHLALFQEFLKSVNAIDRDSWVGISGNGLGNSAFSAVPILGILSAIAIPNFKKARSNAREKACFANQRVLQGAVEMYNMDNQVMMKELDIETLRKGSLLHSPIECPDRGTYSSVGDLSSGGHISCSVHGEVPQN